MWGHQQQPPATKSAPQTPDPAPPESPPVEPAAAPERSGADPESDARIGHGILIKGEVSGDRDVYVDGEIEGTLTLPENALIVSPKGKVRARVKTRSLTLWGHLEGKVQATEKIEIRQSGSLLGDLVTVQIVIEDGGTFRGNVELLKPEKKEKQEKAPPQASKPSPGKPS